MCRKKFKSTQSLSYHIENGVCAKHSCRFCSKRFANSQGLNYHIQQRVCLGPRVPTNITVRKQTLQEFTKLQLKDTTDIIEELKALTVPSDILIGFIKKTLCDDRFRGYFSVHVSNKTGNTVNVYNDSTNEWILEPKKKVLTAISVWAIDLLSTEIPVMLGFIPNSSVLNEIFCALYNQRTKIKEAMGRPTKSKTG